MKEADFELESSNECCFGDDERTIFFYAGRPDLYEAVMGCQCSFSPAIAGGYMRPEAAAGVTARFPADCILSGARVALDSRRAVRATLLVQTERSLQVVPGKNRRPACAKSLRVMNLK